MNNLEKTFDQDEPRIYKFLDLEFAMTPKGFRELIFATMKQEWYATYDYVMGMLRGRYVTTLSAAQYDKLHKDYIILQRKSVEFLREYLENYYKPKEK